MKLSDKITLHTKLDREKMFTWILYILVAVQVLFIIYINLFQTKAALDSDSAMLYTHAIEMWRNKTLFLPNWSNTTTLELDSALLFALPLYGITKQIYLSIGISNVIFLGIYLYVIIDLLKKVKLSNKHIALALGIFLMPYAFGMLDYFNMMFINGSQYGIKVILPLMLLALLFTPREEQLWKRNIVLYVMYVFLLFISTFSSGLYVVLCGLLPITGTAMLDYLLDGGNQKCKKYNLYHLILFVVSALVSAIGYIGNVVTGTMARGNNMFLVQADNFVLNLQTCVKGIFQLLGAFPEETIDVITFKGIAILIKIGLVVLLLAVFLIRARKLFRTGNEMNIRKYLMTLFLVNLLILVFCDTRYNVANTTMEYRYYMIGIIPLMLLLAIQLSDWDEQWNRLSRTVVYTLAIIALAIVTKESIRNTVDLLGEHEYVHEVVDYLSTLDATSVTYVLDEETAKCSRLIDQADGGTERNYAFFDPDSGKVSTFDYYEDVFDRTYYGDNNLIVVIQGTNLVNVLPTYIANSYSYVGTVRWFDVYQSPVCRLDYRSGYPLKERELSIDYAYSPDYSYHGTITEQGTLHTTGNGADILNSAYFDPSDQVLNITATYAVADTTLGKVGTMELRDQDGNVAASADIRADANSVTIPSVAIEGRSLQVVLRVDTGVVCEIGQIEFRTVKE